MRRIWILNWQVNVNETKTDGNWIAALTYTKVEGIPVFNWFLTSFRMRRWIMKANVYLIFDDIQLIGHDCLHNASALNAEASIFRCQFYVALVKSSPEFKSRSTFYARLRIFCLLAVGERLGERERRKEIMRWSLRHWREKGNLTRRWWKGDNLVIQIRLWSPENIAEAVLCAATRRAIENSVYNFPALYSLFLLLSAHKSNTISNDYKFLMVLIINSIS